MRLRELIPLDEILEEPKNFNIPMDKIKAHPTEGGHYPKMVEKYRSMIRRKKSIEPIFLDHDKETDIFHIDDGHHRFKAHQMEGKKHILAQVFDLKTRKTWK